MRSLKKVLPPALVLAAFAIALVALLGDRTGAYGTVSLPAGGTVELPQGQADVFVHEPGSVEGSDDLSRTLRFEVYPAAGGQPLPKEPTGKESTSTDLNKRSQEMGDANSVAAVEVPAKGSYFVDGSFGQNPAAEAPLAVELEFGEDPFSALASKWKLMGLLLGVAFVIWLVPMPRPEKTHWQDELAEQGAR